MVYGRHRNKLVQMKIILKIFILNVIIKKYIFKKWDIDLLLELAQQ